MYEARSSRDSRKETQGRVAMGQDNIGKMAQGGRLKTKRVDTEAAKTGG